MQYRRSKVPGATYFFTVVTYERQPLFNDPKLIKLLRQTFRQVKQPYPFTLDAISILPDHLHCIWTLPPDDADFSRRWQRIKSSFSRHCPPQYHNISSISRQKKREKSIWQHRFWEHQIRDETDFIHHVDYIHYNPVKHGLVNAPKDWQYSSFHHYLKDGAYTLDWGANQVPKLTPDIGHE
ncbi:REP-associated tyrosine transposase [Spirulina subsalsa]|uniref:REP-associated tyrosine transposase n=1 Tax=Spirulina subsalsa TaxID=54311 RepID=UPI0008FB06E5|nr:transposase [Spirulina subsalsa]